MPVKVPKGAKRVFHGTVFDIYQKRQKLYNGETKIFEWAKRIDGASLIATVGDKIVVLRQRQPTKPWYYTLPGGFMDKPGETPKAAALRELLEETGLKPCKLKLWRTFPSRGARLITNLYVFIAQDCRKIAEPELDGGEKIEVKYYTFNQFLHCFEDPDFHATELMIDMLKIMHNPNSKAKLKKEIYGNSNISSLHKRS